MKKLLLALLLLIGVEARAQKTNQVLVVANNVDVQSWTRLMNAIKLQYSGVVSVRGELPDVLDYDAVMMIAPNKMPYESWLDSAQQTKLLNFVKAGGAFYAEGAGFRNGSDQQTSFNQFWDFIGDSSEGATAMFIRVDSVFGTPGEFAEGIGYKHPYPANEWDAGGGFHIEGMVGVLHVNATYPFDIAYRSPSTGIKAVLHWPIVTEHYEQFIASVVCTYFQLCQLHVDEEVVSKEIRFDPRRRMLLLPGGGEVTIYDLLGRAIINEESASEYHIPQSLQHGVYLVTWQDGDRQLSQMIVLP